MTQAGSPIAPLLAPLTLRGVMLKTRIVMAPMTREHSSGGVPGADVAAYYRRRAEGNVALIITEGVALDDPAAVDMPGVPAMYGAVALAGWKAVVDGVHAAGGLIFPQLWHQGALRDAAGSPHPNVAPRRPSGVLGPLGKVSLDDAKLARLAPDTAALTESEIGDIIASYARAAKAAADLGFDGIAIHGGHGYLPDNFLWHGTNLRQDRWGGSPERRAEFPAALVRAISESIGQDLPILFRFSQFKMQDYNARLAETPDELGRLLAPIADAGVDIFDGSQRLFDTPAFPDSPLNLGAWAKKLTGKLGMTGGGVGLDKGKRDHHIDSGSGSADNLGRLAARFQRGEFDLVGVGRSLLNDPAWLDRAINGLPFLPFDDTNLRRLT